MSPSEMTSTPRRMSLPPILAHKEGERIQIPEGGELVCFKNPDGRLGLNVLYSRETLVKLSSSLLCQQRPTDFRRIVEDTPELLGLPHPIPASNDLPVNAPPTIPMSPVVSQPLRIFSPLRGPIMPVDEKTRILNVQREHRLDEPIPLNFDSPSAPRDTA